MDPAQCDMFSDLPLHLVLIIISYLSLSEAFRLCVLKKEWFYAKLWRNCNSIEIRETSFAEISNRRRWSDSHLHLGKSSFRDTVLRDIGKLRFVHFLNTTLPQLISPTLTTFNLQMAYASKYTNYIDQWIGFALSKNARVLILDFSDASPNSMQTPNNTYYVLRHFFYENGECIRFLSLNTCYLDNHTFCSFESLKVLWMTNVMIFTGKVTDLLLIRCPLLEDLVLVECCNLIQVEIFYSLERLKRVVVRHCSPLTDGIQLMCLPMLQYVEYVGRFCPFEVDGLDALEEVVLDFQMDPYRKDEPRRFQEIRESLFGFVQAMVIKITTFAFKVLLLEYMSGPPLRQLENVHQLTLITCMRKYELPGILSFLKSVPNLRSLTIASVFIWPRVATNDHDNLELTDEFWTPQGWSLDHLEWVQIDGFTGKEYEVNLLKFIMRNAKMLHKIVITPRNRGNASNVFEELANVEVASERVFIEWCNVEDTKQKEHVCFKRLGQNEAVKP